MFKTAETGTIFNKLYLENFNTEEQVTFSLPLARCGIHNVLYDIITQVKKYIFYNHTKLLDEFFSGNLYRTSLWYNYESLAAFEKYFCKYDLTFLLHY